MFKNLEKDLSQSVHSNDQVIIRVHNWYYKKIIPNQYITYKPSLSIIRNYIFRVGLKAVLRKVISRFSEIKRNNKFYGIAIGQILNTGQKVLFFAPNHNPLWEYVVVEKGFIIYLEKNKHLDNSFQSKYIFPNTLKKYIGYSSFSGIKIDIDLVIEELNKIKLIVKKIDKRFKYIETNYITSRSILIKKNNNISGVVFGLGNYAKTIILPNLNKKIRIERVHEIDPDQIRYLKSNKNIELSTSSIPLDEKYFDAWFIAGYHSTHMDLAIKAIKQNAYAIIEKPLATNLEELEEFKYQLMNNKSNFFCCFHKRYSYLNNFLKKDIDYKKPINMHCIVYEIPLPLLHWYNWPSSKTRIVSNACHWIDYFLFLNSYSDIEEKYIWNPTGEDFCLNLKLVNGSYFSMNLTDKGSMRLGVRDYIELRQEDITVKMIDSSRYISESRSKIIRRKRVNPLSAYKLMYKAISSKIARRERGDSIKSLLSSQLTLELDNSLKKI